MSRCIECKYHLKDNLVVDDSLRSFSRPPVRGENATNLFSPIKYLRVKGSRKSIAYWWKAKSFWAHMCDAIYITNINQLTNSRRYRQISGFWLPAMCGGKFEEINFDYSIFCECRVMFKQTRMPWHSLFVCDLLPIEREKKTFSSRTWMLRPFQFN